MQALVVPIERNEPTLQESVDLAEGNILGWVIERHHQGEVLVRGDRGGRVVAPGHEGQPTEDGIPLRIVLVEEAQVVPQFVGDDQTEELAQCGQTPGRELRSRAAVINIESSEIAGHESSWRNTRRTLYATCVSSPTSIRLSTNGSTEG